MGTKMGSHDTNAGWEQRAILSHWTGAKGFHGPDKHIVPTLLFTVATLSGPNGHTVPSLWCSHYDHKWHIVPILLLLPDVPHRHGLECVMHQSSLHFAKCTYPKFTRSTNVGESMQRKGVYLYLVRWEGKKVDGDEML